MSTLYAGPQENPQNKIWASVKSLVSIIGTPVVFVFDVVYEARKEEARLRAHYNL